MRKIPIILAVALFAASAAHAQQTTKASCDCLQTGVCRCGDVCDCAAVLTSAMSALSPVQCAGGNCAVPQAAPRAARPAVFSRVQSRPRLFQRVRRGCR
jgi:hypothetical protein